jgi:hypothetical protein
MVTLVLATIVVALSTSVEAGTVCVNPAGGDDSRTKAAVSASWTGKTCTAPWATLGRAVWGSPDRDTPSAAQAAAAGDTVIVAAGTYTTDEGGGRASTATTYQPVNSGSSDNPIVFTCATYGSMPAACVLRYSGKSPGGNFIGVNGQSYVTWRGFQIDATTNPACTGMLVNVRDSKGVVIEWNEVIGDPKCTPDDNHAGIWVSSDTSFVTIRNNKISGIRNSQRGRGNENGAGIIVYEAGHGIIEHNDISDSGAGIALKAPFGNRGGFSKAFGPWTVRYNLLHDLDLACVNVHRNPASASQPTKIYSNVCKDSGICLHVHLFDGGKTDPSNNWFINNTCHNWASGGRLQAIEIESAVAFQPNANNRVRNNIFRGGGRILALNQPDGEYVASKWNQDYNWYSKYDSGFMFGTFDGNFGNWKGSSEADAHSVNGTDPKFVNEAAGDFHLAPGSPARGACPDELDLDGDGSTTDMVACGAYATGNEVIGLARTPRPN